MPATVLNIAKSASPEEDGPLPVETCPVKVELLIKDTTKTTENVETSGTDNTAEHVETNGIDNETEHVETCPLMPHVATSNTDQSVCTEDTEQPLTGVSASKNDTYGCTAAIAPPSEITTSSIGAETGDDQTAADSLPETQKDTSTQVPSKSDTLAPLQYSNNDADDEKTDAYSEEEPMKDINIEPQIPVTDGNFIEAGNDTVEISTDPLATHKNTDAKRKSIRKSVGLKLQPLRDIDIDIWSNKVGTYHKFEMDTVIPNKENDVTHVDKNVETTTDDSLSLRDHNEIDYTLMLASDMESESETSRKKLKKYRPSASGPSATRQRAHKRSKSSKTSQTILPQHSYPIRGYKPSSKPPNEVETNPLPVETDCNGMSETSQVETMADAGHVATPNSKCANRHPQQRISCDMQL